jgi:anti-sigma factor RsiW
MRNVNTLHLPIDRLAELADTDPSALEREHLAACAACAVELEAYRRMVALAADERRRIAPPLTDWDSMRRRLHREGLLASTAPVDVRRARRVVLVATARRIAAGAVLLLGGAVYGRLSTGQSFGQALALGRVSFAPFAAADSVGEGLTAETFASTAVALQALQDAQRSYEQAALYLAAHDTSTAEPAGDLIRTRLAALDRMAETSQRALDVVPADPIINQVYLTTMGAREMTLSRLGTVLPAGVRLTRY